MPTQQWHAKVLIAGGSITGLTLANIFERTGVDYLVLEKYRDIAPNVGASICVFPNGFRILDQLGCYDTIKKLAEDADSFRNIVMRNIHGYPINKVLQASHHLRMRMGYAPIFVDRQMIIRVLYDNLGNKSNVLVGKDVYKVEQIPNGVQVRTRDGDVFTGKVLIGADGIHSTVRREMWRLADERQPGYFPSQERVDVPIEYCCIFGTSKASNHFPKFTAQHVQGKNHSYLISTGPRNCVYWFLFKRLPCAARGLYEKIPRYTDVERDALAEQHANDRLAETLCFGDLYRMRITATLQALPEVVFSKWHYGRIMTIGDAAHKFNPIGGQGGNSAIEDAADLANHLLDLLHSTNQNTDLTDTNIAAAFEKTQCERYDRALAFLNRSHAMQSVQAMDSLATRLIAKYIMPWISNEQILESICSDSRPAARLEMLDLRKRVHCDLYFDERPAKPLQTKHVRILATGVFSILAYFALTQNWPPDAKSPYASMMRPQPFEHFNGKISPSVDLAETNDAIGILQSSLVISLIIPIITIWNIEGNRYGSQGSALAWPALYAIISAFTSLNVALPIHFLFSIWVASSPAYVNGFGRHIPEHVCRALIPSLLLGYFVPVSLILNPLSSVAYRRYLGVICQFAPAIVSILLFGFLRTQSVKRTKVWKFNASAQYNISHLFQAYKILFITAVLYHTVNVSVILSMATSIWSFWEPNFIFAALNVILYGLYNTYDLRHHGLITTDRAIIAGCLYACAKCMIGPGAATVGLWWWRESCMWQGNKDQDQDQG